MGTIQGTSDSLLVADNISRIDHRLNQTLIAQGIGHIITGRPGTGAHTRFAYRAFTCIATLPGND